MWHVYKKGRWQRWPGGVVDIQVGGTACDNGLAGNARQRAQCCWCIHLWDRAVTSDGPHTGARQWGLCSGVGEAGRPGGQHRSEMTAVWSALPASVNLADDVAWCLARPVTGAWLIVESRLLLWTGSCGAAGADIDRLLELVGWHCGVANQRAGVDRCACIGPPPLQPPSAPFIEITSLYPCLLRTGETGWWGGAAKPTPSRLTVPIKDVNERRTSLEIVYATWRVWQCDVCMPFDTSRRSAIKCNLWPLILRH